jgi:hypothetical protein
MEPSAEISRNVYWAINGNFSRILQHWKRLKAGLVATNDIQALRTNTESLAKKIGDVEQ